MRRSKVVQLAESKGVSPKEYLRALYDQHGSQVKVAAQIGISQGRLSQVIKEVGLEEKTILKDVEAC